MPNTPKGGGVSRKIVNSSDRQRLKKVVEGLNVPQGIAVIIRTAGSKRTKTEIKRDFNLVSIWEEVKNKTIKSNVPINLRRRINCKKSCLRYVYNRN